jgi:hypothetical protein
MSVNILISPLRIEIEDRVRRADSEPNESDRKDIDRLRKLLSTQLDMWDQIRTYTPPSENSCICYDAVDDEIMFDDLENEENNYSNEIVEASSSQSISGINSDVVPPEKRVISVPSQWIKNHPYQQVELKLRIKQAAASLAALWDLIAEKSFQYSHVIRVAPKKGVRTRARSVIAQLNHRIGYHCRIYNRCRVAMEKLEADSITLGTYQILQQQDIRCSTALLNPNEPGSTRHQLSWIWQNGPSLTSTNSEGLRECK